MVLIEKQHVLVPVQLPEPDSNQRALRQIEQAPRFVLHAARHLGFRSGGSRLTQIFHLD